MTAERLRFLMVTTFYPPYNFGGDGMFVRRLANELVTRGHHVEVVHCVDSYRLLRPRTAVREGPPCADPGIVVHALRSRLGSLSPLITQQTGLPGLKALRLRRIMTRGGFDVIHFHNLSLIGPTALSYGRAVKLYTMHEHWLVCPTHVLFRFGREPCPKKRCVACTIVAGRPPQLWRYTPLLSRMLRHVDAFIAPSRFTASKHREMGLVVDAPIEHIPNFLAPPQAPAPSDGTPSHPRPYFLFVGRLEPIKGAHILVDAFRRYRAADLVIAGTGHQEPGLRQIAAEHPHIHLLGQARPERLASLYRDARALIVPSAGYEVFPTVVLEAFAHGTPVLGHRLGPIPEMIDESGGGVTYGNEAELTAGLERLRTDQAWRDELGRRGLAAYRARWTPDRHFGAYFGLIDRIRRAKAS